MDRLYELAKVIRSKNSGPFKITLDILFDEKSKYEKVKNSGVLTKKKLHHFTIFKRLVLAACYFSIKL